MLLSKNKIKYLKSLQDKKTRKQEKCFLVEGEKIVLETLQTTHIIKEIYCTQSFFNKYQKLIENKKIEVYIVDNQQLTQIGHLQNNQSASILMPFLDFAPIKPHSKGLTLVLDTIQDPGNLGTIIRIADWFGVNGVICSTDCVDIYNHKVLSATMASFLRVNVKYLNLQKFLTQNQHLSIFGAVLGGQNLYEIKTKINGILVMGNESKGISNNILPFIQHKITIPRFGEAESLNVSIATSILCNHWRQFGG
jgi:TrmH family RNA methyltransferase